MNVREIIFSDTGSDADERDWAERAAASNLEDRLNRINHGNLWEMPMAPRCSQCGRAAVWWLIKPLAVLLLVFFVVVIVGILSCTAFSDIGFVTTMLTVGVCAALVLWRPTKRMVSNIVRMYMQKRGEPMLLPYVTPRRVHEEEVKDDRHIAINKSFDAETRKTDA